MGGGKIKNKDHLSLAEAEVEAELGKNKDFAQQQKTKVVNHVVEETLNISQNLLFVDQLSKVISQRNDFVSI